MNKKGITAIIVVILIVLIVIALFVLVRQINISNRDRPGDKNGQDGNGGIINGDNGISDGEDDIGDGTDLDIVYSVSPSSNPELPASTLIDVKYGDRAANIMDIYPGDKYEKTFVIVVPGGGFQISKKETTAGQAKWFNDRGYSVANVQYSVVPEGIRYPEQPQEILEAMNYLEENYGAEQFILYGFSAGATIAGQIALAQNNNYDFGISYPDSDIVALINVGGVYYYDLLKDEAPPGESITPQKAYADYANGKIDESLPSTYADSNDLLPVLLIAGEGDTTGPAQASVDLANELPNAESHILSGYRHADARSAKEAYSLMSELLSEIEN